VHSGGEVYKVEFPALAAELLVSLLENEFDDSVASEIGLSKTRWSKLQTTLAEDAKACASRAMRDCSFDI